MNEGDPTHSPPDGVGDPGHRRGALTVAALVAVTLAGVFAFGWLIGRGDGGDRAAPPTVELLPTTTTHTEPRDAPGDSAPTNRSGESDGGGGGSRGSSGPRGDRVVEDRCGAGKTDRRVGEGWPQSEGVVRRLATFVEKETGRRFLRPVVVDQEGDRSFRRRLLDQFREDEEDLRTDGRLLQALGIIPRDTDVVEALRDLLGFGVVGFYDPESDELVVRGQRDTPFVRSTMVHELVHALDDQWFDLDRSELDEMADESAFGLSAVAEGHARLIEERWKRTLTPSQRAALELEELSMPVPPEVFDVPPILIRLVLAPYELGERFVSKISSEVGCGVEDAFAVPPDTSAEVMDPQLWLEGFEPVKVPKPEAEGRVIDEGVFGELMLGYLLEGVTPQSDEVASEWTGDWYVAWDRGGETCVRIDFATGGSPRTLLAALRAWADDHGEATVQPRPGGLVRLTACG